MLGQHKICAHTVKDISYVSHTLCMVPHKICAHSVKRISVCNSHIRLNIRYGRHRICAQHYERISYVSHILCMVNISYALNRCHYVNKTTFALHSGIDSGLLLAIMANAWVCLREEDTKRAELPHK